MENIFEGAKFGDKFVTRDGRVALYYGKGTNDYHLLIPKSYGSFLAYHSNGKEIEEEEHDVDIVSIYQEPIDEKKLDEIVECLLDDAYCDEDMELERKAAIYGCKLGYKKAKSE